MTLAYFLIVLVFGRRSSRISVWPKLSFLSRLDDIGVAVSLTGWLPSILSTHCPSLWCVQSEKERILWCFLLYGHSPVGSGPHPYRPTSPESLLSSKRSNGMCCVEVLLDHFTVSWTSQNGLNTDCICIGPSGSHFQSRSIKFPISDIGTIFPPVKWILEQLMFLSPPL